MKCRAFFNWFLLSTVLVFCSSTAHAGSITWGAATTIAGDTEVSTTGTQVFAYDWANSVQTVNNAAFTAPTAGVTLSGGSVNGTYPFSSPTSSGFSSAYRAILPGAYAENAVAPHTLTVTLNNLTVGHQYQVQWWAEDSRTYGFGRNTILTSPGGNTVTLQLNTANVNNGTGQYSIGTFTADATTQTITATANIESHLNALQLRDLGTATVTVAPGFNPPGGTYVGAQSVTISSEAGSTVYFTTDGSTPTTSSSHGTPGSGSATAGIPGGANLTITAYATKGGKADSPIASAAYITSYPQPATPSFNPPAGEFLGQQTITLTSDSGSTVFYTTDGSIPTSASAHGTVGAGSAIVTIPAPSGMLIHAFATRSGAPDSNVSDAYYTTVTELGPATIFTGPHRRGTNQDGVVKTGWGVEQTMMYEDGIFKSWYHGAPDSNGDYWNNPVIRYATSPDGVNWTDQGVCLGNSPYYRACPFTYHLTTPSAAGEPAGYYMPVGRNGQFGFDLFYSVTGLPGSWTQLNNGNLIIPLGPSGAWDGFRTGNICIWYEANQWQVLYEAAVSSGRWNIGRAYGPSLTNLTKYAGSPVMSNNSGSGCIAGGPEVHKVASTYYCIIHESDPVGWPQATPTSCSLLKSTDLNNWKRVGWISRLWVNKDVQSQVGDGTLLSVNGKTYLWYEDQAAQNPVLPSLSLMTWDMPFEELVNHPEWLDDTGLDGWSFDAGYAEVPAAAGGFPTTYFRKLSAPISPNCMILNTDANHELRTRRPVGLNNGVFTFAALAEQTNRKFTPLRMDADSNDTVLAGAFFDLDGMIKYYNGATITTACAYAANVTYSFSYNCTPGGYSLSINGSLVAANIPYASAYVAPASYKIELTPGATGYVGVVSPVFNPVPADGAQNVAPSPTLSWSVSDGTCQHDVYFGTDPAAVEQASPGFPEYKGRLNTTVYSPVIVPQAGATTFFWRVDEVKNGTVQSTGPVWSFTVNLTTGAAQPYVVARTAEQLAARIPVILDVVGNSYALNGSQFDTLAITSFNTVSLNGAAVTVANNQLTYTPQGAFSGSDTFTYSVTDLFGTVSSATVTILAINQPHYLWDANGASSGTGGSGTWDTSTLSWDDGSHVWPGTGSSNLACFTGTAGTVSIAASGVSANGLYFSPDGYVVQNNTLTLNGTSPVVMVDPGAIATIHSILSGSAGLTKLGSGTLTLDGSNTFTGPTTINSGTLRIGSGGTSGSLAVSAITNNGTLDYHRSDTNDINIPITGAGTLSADAGSATVGIRQPVNLAAVSLGSTYPSSGMSLYGSSYAAAINLFSNITTTGDQTYTGVVSIGRGSGNPTTTLTTTGGGMITLAGGVVSGVSGYWSSGTLNIDTSAGNGAVTLAGTSLAYGVGNLNVNSGMGRIRLTGGTYCYDYAVFNGPVELTGDSAFSPVNGQQWARGVTFNGDLSGDFVLTASLGSGAAQSTGTGTPGLIFASATTQNISVGIAGGSGVIKSGQGTTVLTENCSYTGATTVNSGTLTVNGSLATGSAVTVNAGATLAGHGVVGGTVSIAGNVAPGDGVPGTLTLGNATLTGSYVCRIDGGGSDCLTTGALNLSGANLEVSEVHAGTAFPYVIANYTTLTGTFASVTPGYSVDYTTPGVIRLIPSYASWSAAMGISSGPSGVDNPDRLPNLMEYALGLDPRVSNGSPGSLVGNILSFTKGNAAKAAGDIVYAIETSDDLGVESPWQPATTGVTEDADSISFQFPAGKTKCFARLKVTQKG